MCVIQGIHLKYHMCECSLNIVHAIEIHLLTILHTQGHLENSRDQSKSIFNACTYNCSDNHLKVDTYNIYIYTLRLLQMTSTKVYNI